MAYPISILFRRSGYQLIVWAIVASDFEEVLHFDSDVLLLDPGAMFASRAFHETGYVPSPATHAILIQLKAGETAICYKGCKDTFSYYTGCARHF